MSLTLMNAMLLTPTEQVEGWSVVISDGGEIAYIGPADLAPRASGDRIDLRGRILAPGLTDIHTHGGFGVTFGQGNLATELNKYSEWVAKSGVTTFVPSIAAKTSEELMEQIKQYVVLLSGYGLAKDQKGARPIGLHLEGPYLSKEKLGVFDPSWLHNPSLEEAKLFLKTGKGWIKHLTMAPELPNASEVASFLRSNGVTVALGHSNTDYETASAALRGNFTHVTHTFNAQKGFDHRSPGVFGAVLSSDFVTAELIADTVHVHPGAMKVLFRCLGKDRIVLITDAMAGAGLADGEYELLGKHVFVKNGRANLVTGTIAGSTATLNTCVKNVNQYVGASLGDAVQMASLNPARMLGLSNSIGSISIGKDANLIVIDEDVNVYLTIVNGHIVYNNL